MAFREGNANFRVQSLIVAEETRLCPNGWKSSLSVRLGGGCGLRFRRRQAAARRAFLGQSGEAFPTEDAAWDDARKALKELRGPSRPAG